MAATARNPIISFESMNLKPPLHPTYDLNGVIKLALAEDSGGQGYLILSPILFSSSSKWFQWLLNLVLFVLPSQGRVLL